MVQRASRDERICGAALVGSAATASEDEFSDIDLALRLSPSASLHSVVDDWTEWMRSEQSVVTSMDVQSDGALYRVFLLASTLQVDLSFWEHDQYGGNGRDAFVVLFGEEGVTRSAGEFRASSALDMAWLYALHVRSALARGRVWQALYMINGLRNQLVAVWSQRAGENPSQARGIDRLAPRQLHRLEATVPFDTTIASLRAAFAAEIELLVEEIPELSAVLIALLGDR